MHVVGLKIFRSNSQVNHDNVYMFIIYILLKGLPNETMQLILYWWRPFYVHVQYQSTGDIIRLDSR